MPDQTMQELCELPEKLAAVMADYDCDECLSALVFLLTDVMSQLSDNQYDEVLAEDVAMWVSKSYAWHLGSTETTDKIVLN